MITLRVEKRGVIFSSSNYPELTGIFDYELSPNGAKAFDQNATPSPIQAFLFCTAFFYMI